MIRKQLFILIWGLAVLCLMVGCSKSTVSSDESIKKYKDGTYAVETKPDGEGYFTAVELTIKEDVIKSVDWNILDSRRDNRIFDETYEEVFPQKHYKEQCRADLAGSKKYGSKLIKTQDIEMVDAITGATWANKKFKEGVRLALMKATILKDGIYEGELAVDFQGYLTKATLEIKDGIITTVDWRIIDTNNGDRVYDETYEEVFEDEEDKRKVRDNLEGINSYGDKLVETQDIHEVKALPGALWSHVKFTQVIQKTLRQAY